MLISDFYGTAVDTDQLGQDDAVFLVLDGCPVRHPGLMAEIMQRHVDGNGADWRPDGRLARHPRGPENWGPIDNRHEPGRVRRAERGRTGTRTKMTIGGRAASAPDGAARIVRCTCRGAANGTTPGRPTPWCGRKGRCRSAARRVAPAPSRYRTTPPAVGGSGASASASGPISVRLKRPRPAGDY